MVDRTNRQDWSKAPARRFRDIVSPTPAPAHTAGSLRTVLAEIGLKALTEDWERNLVLPPPRSHVPSRLSGQKDLHKNRFVEVGIVISGEMTIWWDGAITRCPTGSVFVIPPGMRYLPHAMVSQIPPQPHAVVWLALHRGCAIVHRCSIEGEIHSLGEYHYFTEMQVTTLARSIAQELSERGMYYTTSLRGLLLCLLTWVLRAPVYRISRLSTVERDRSPDQAESFSDRVESYLLSHYHRPLSLGQIAASVGCSPAYLCRRFRELTGQTPFQFLREIRIEAAKGLLRSDVPISRVAEMVGYDDPLYFSRVFSRQTGASPQVYRQAQHGGKTDTA